VIRTFVAVDIPESESLRNFLGRLKDSGSRLSVPRAEGVHVTLKFLGDIPEASVEKISEILREIATSFMQFEVEIKGSGCFPNPRNPRVLWAGLQDNGQLVELARRVDESMVRIGFEPEKRAFTPHITIARVKSPKDIDKAMNILREFEDESFGSFKVIDIRLKKSTLTPSGALYEDLSVLKLSETV